MTERRPSVFGARHVLVVDDEATIRGSLVELLRQYGYGVTGATDGRDALAKLRAAPDLYGVIVLDLTMPVMDGRAFREEQRRDPELAEIPVIVLSARRDAAKSAQDLDVAACLAKPLEMPGLLEVVARVHRRRAQ